MDSPATVDAAWPSTLLLSVLVTALTTSLAVCAISRNRSTAPEHHVSSGGGAGELVTTTHQDVLARHGDDASIGQYSPGTSRSVQQMPTKPGPVHPRPGVVPVPHAGGYRRDDYDWRTLFAAIEHLWDGEPPQKVLTYAEDWLTKCGH